jgi:hypothetical protein
MPVNTRIQFRRGTAAAGANQWTTQVLYAGEVGYETDTGRFKIGDGSTAWNSLKYAAVVPTGFIGNSGIYVNPSSNGETVTISVSGITSSQMNDFNTAVDNRISLAAVSPSQVMNIVNSGLAEGNNIDLSYNTGTNIVTVSVTGLTIGSDVQAYDAGLASIASLTTTSNNYIYTTSSDTYTTGVITSFGRSLLDDADAAAGRTTLGLGTISTFNSGDYSLAGHSHVVSDITNFASGVSGLLPSFTGVSGVQVSPLSNNQYTISLSDPSIQVGDITDFGSGVSGLVNGIYAPLNSPALTGTPTAPTAAADTNTTQLATTAFVLGQASSSNPNMDGSVSAGSSNKYSRADHVHPSDTSRAALNGAVFTGSVTIPSGSGNFNYLNVSNTPVSLSGHTHTSSDITNFNSSVSGLLGVKSLVQGSGIGISNSGGIQTISVTGIPSSFITDLGNIATTEVVGRTGIRLTYDAVYDKMYIDTTGVSLVGHTHTWSDITDASTKATLSELTYLSGVSAGTASASRALVLDSNKSITAINAITTTGNVTVGGDLVVQGTTTTVNSTVVEIGDNIVKVNTSGLNTGGMEVYTGTDTKSIVWNTSANRWEFTGGNVYTSGYFLGSLSGNASTVTNGVYTTDTGTVTNTMLYGGIAYNKLSLSGSIVNSDISNTAAIQYSKLNLSGSITNSDIAAGASIGLDKLSYSGFTLGTTTINLSTSGTVLDGLTRISGASASTPTVLYYCTIDGGTP